MLICATHEFSHAFEHKRPKKFMPFRNFICPAHKKKACSWASGSQIVPWWEWCYPQSTSSWSKWSSVIGSSCHNRWFRRLCLTKPKLRNHVTKTLTVCRFARSLLPGNRKFNWNCRRNCWTPRNWTGARCFIWRPASAVRWAVSQPPPPPCLMSLFMPSWNSDKFWFHFQKQKIFTLLRRYGHDTGLSYVSWMVFGLPQSLINLIFVWLILMISFMGFKY